MFKPEGHDPYNWGGALHKSDTSHQAAQSIKPRRTALQDHVEFSVKYGLFPPGATCDEIERATGLSHQTASARLRELVLNGRIEDSGERRKTRSGRLATVWRVKAAPDSVA
jgi:Fic family protein